uniref:Integrase catalytic domain-containing protein n=1 Tax=Tanacetum cinerariifolium TaxID=118510 RepID=A0A699JMQ8_TANCI|nr:hypothetical protein [Tanacetum cinerariifolium]
MLEMSKDELILAIDEIFNKDDASRFLYVYLLHVKDEALDKFRIYKIEVELQQNDLIKTLHTDRGGEYYDPVFFQSVGVIHETTAPYTPQQNGIAKRKNRALKEMVNSMLSYSSLSEGAVVRLPDPKRKSLGEKGIDCIFVGYAEHFKAYRDDHSDDVPSGIFEPRKGKRVRKAKSYGYDFQIYLVEGSRDQKEAIDDEIRSIMENKTWILFDFPPGCKPLGCKWIFKKKMKVDGTIDKFKARLVIHVFRQKEGIDYFDTYAPVPRITTIGLLLALAAIHNLVIHQWIYPLVLEGYSDASWINHVEDSSSTSGWVFLLRGDATSWVSKKQTCITGSTMEFEFVALASAGKETEWLRNLIHEILIWPKPIAPISIRCDNAPIMARVYSQRYNGKSRHLGARTKRATYVNMKFFRFKKLGLGFLYVH